MLLVARDFRSAIERAQFVTKCDFASWKLDICVLTKIYNLGSSWFVQFAKGMLVYVGVQSRFNGGVSWWKIRYFLL